MANGMNTNCRYKMIVHIGYIVLTICILVHSNQKTAAKAHIGKFLEMIEQWNFHISDLAIVGAGIGGISTAYWLKYYLNESIAITIYESNEVYSKYS